MKVLMINGSPNEHGNTYLALAEVAKALNAEGVETEIEWIGKKAVQGCIACRKCRELGRCVFHDELYETLRERLAALSWARRCTMPVQTDHCAPFSTACSTPVPLKITAISPQPRWQWHVGAELPLLSTDSTNTLQSAICRWCRRSIGI